MVFSQVSLRWREFDRTVGAIGHAIAEASHGAVDAVAAGGIALVKHIADILARGEAIWVESSRVLDCGVGKVVDESVNTVLTLA